MPRETLPGAAVKLGPAQLRVARCLAIDAALVEVSAGLAARGVRPLLIKGPATARSLYDDSGERSYDDIDLLVDPDRFETAERVLAELGFEPLAAHARAGEFAEHHAVWVRRGRRAAAVELHHTLALLSAPPVLVWRRLFAGSRLVEVRGARIAVTSPAASALIIGLHAAQHGAGAAKPLRDLRRAVERFDESTWRAAAALADELGGGAAFAVGLGLDPGGRQLADRLGLDAAGASRRVDLLADTHVATAFGIERMMSAHGSRARAALLARELVPSPAFMRSWQPLARRGRSGLAVAYVWRPFWLVAKLPRGIRAWLRAPHSVSGRG